MQTLAQSLRLAGLSHVYAVTRAAKLVSTTDKDGSTTYHLSTSAENLPTRALIAGYTDTYADHDRRMNVGM